MTESIIAVPGIERTSSAFRTALVAAGRALGIDPDFLATVMSFETAHTFDPAQKNMAGSGAVGLIQFMPSTAARLGTTTGELAQMSSEDQLLFVRKYFAPVAARLRTLEDVYLAVLFPAGIGKPLDSVLFEPGTVAYEQNKGFDRAKKGFVTVGDVTTVIRGLYQSSLSHARVALGEVVATEGPKSVAPLRSLVPVPSWLSRSDVVPDGDHRLRVIRHGDVGAMVAMWQVLLRDEFYPEEEDLPVTGRMDSVTVEATRKWQAKMSLPPDGVVGFMCWGRMLQ